MTSRWHGKIGFGVTKEIGKGIWKPTIEEREYYGNIISVQKTAESQPYFTNDAIRINSKISIIPITAIITPVFTSSIVAIGINAFFIHSK